MFGSSNYIDLVDNAFIFIVVISTLLLAFITALMIFFVFKYKRGNGKKAVNIHGNVSLEIAWTVIPVILVMAMFYYGWIGYDQLSNPPADAMVIKATGQMWKWTFTYDNGIKTDTLLVPQGKAVKVNLESNDVNHAFYIHTFRIKRDVIPNKKNFVWFKPEKQGSYDITCAEYCGLNHSYMYTKLIVLSPAKYKTWMDNQKILAAPAK